MPRETGEVSELQWFLTELERIDGCERTKAQVLRLVKRLEGQVIRFTHRELSRPDRVRRARELLDAGNCKTTVRDALVRSYGCSPRHAYDLIQEALNARRPT